MIFCVHSPAVESEKLGTRDKPLGAASCMREPRKDLESTSGARSDIQFEGEVNIALCRYIGSMKDMQVTAF